MLTARIGCLPQYLIAALAPGAGGCVADSYWGVAGALADAVWVRDPGGPSITWPLTNSGKTLTNGAGAGANVRGSGAAGGTRKVYAEILVGGTSPGASNFPGVGMMPWTLGMGSVGGAGLHHLGSNGTLYLSGVSTGVTGLGNMLTGQVIMMAYDAATGKMWLGRGGTWFAGGDPGTGVNPTATVAAGLQYAPSYSSNTSSTNTTLTLRCKASECSFPLPTGFSEWGGGAVGTTLMLHGDGPDGSLTFTDSSRFARALTLAGNVAIRTLQSKFGGGSIGVPGVSGDSLAMVQSADLDFEIFDGTFEVWVLITATGTARFAYSAAGPSNTVGMSLSITGLGNLNFHAYGTGGLDMFPGAVVDLGALVAGTWVHIAVDKVGYEWFFFRNGALVLSTAARSMIAMGGAAVVPVVGNNQAGGTQPWLGYIEELRITKGYARHVAVLGAAWPTSAPADPSFASVTLLLSGDVAFTDASSLAHTVTTTVGAPAISSAQARFGAASMLFNGSSYIGYAHSADWDFGAGDFTIELDMFATTAANGTTYYLAGYGQGSTVALYAWWLIWTGGGSAQFRISSGAAAVTVNVGILGAGQWHHIAITRSGNTIRVFVDGDPGVGTGTFAGAINNPATATLTIGNVPTGFFPDFFIGHLDNLRITKGVARYTAAFARNYQGVPFSVDTLPFCDVLAGAFPVTPAPISATGATQLLLQTSGTAVVGAAPVPAVDFVDHAPACYEDAGTMSVQLHVTSGAAVIGACSVNWATSNGSAIAGTDYTASSGTANFNDATRTVTLSIPVTDNAAYAAGAAKTFTLTLSVPVGLSIVTSSVPCRIIDNDPVPGVLLTDPTLTVDVITFNSNGTLDSSGVLTAGQWHTGVPVVGIGASFELRATSIAGYVPPSASAYSTWLSLSTARAFGPIGDTPDGNTGTVLFEIRDAATHVVLDSATMIFGSHLVGAGP